ncbi:hypothetical protein TIFTF001_031436 [Ficus carica]|uniref:Uncharacterized protein n=1 Tax=Ficus carica TaxID=3494 RepID=A0AA88DUR5_FICCA|nr:hypothetical protein TIFTF001_031436 [Ficus carica]
MPITLRFIGITAMFYIDNSTEALNCLVAIHDVGRSVLLMRSFNMSHVWLRGLALPFYDVGRLFLRRQSFNISIVWLRG